MKATSVPNPASLLPMRTPTYQKIEAMQTLDTSWTAELSTPCNVMWPALARR